MPEHSVCIAFAIDDHCRHEPAPVEPPEYRHPIQFEILIIDVVIRADPAFLNPRIPVEIDLLGFEKPVRQSLPRAASELDFEP